MTTLPDGFPEDQRQSGAVQAKLTGSGLDVVHERMPELVDMLLESDGPMRFPIPASCSSDPKVCCYVPHGYCELVFDIDERPGDWPRVELEPIGGNQVELTLRARVRTADWLPVHSRGPLGGTIDCYVYIDSSWSGTPHVTIRSIMELADDPVTGTTRGRIVSTSLSGVSGGDVSIDGRFLCNFGSEQEAADNMNAQLRQRIPGELENLLCATCDSDAECAPFGTCGAEGVCELPGGDCIHDIGTSGRMAADAVFGDLVHDAADAIDLYLTLGGGVDTGGGGVQLGVLTGALPARGTEVHECVPTVEQPALPEVASSQVLASGTHPVTGEAYDLGLGIHRSFLERAAWAAHQAGFLCLDVGASRVPLLQADALSILAPSLIDLTRGENAPLFLLVRPQTPPSIELGAGTFTDIGGGEMKIDDPLLTIGLDELEIDFFAWIDERYARILTLRADMTVPVGLDVDGEGKVIPVLGDLAESFDEIRVVSSGLLAESPEAIADRFPAVLSVALPALSDALDGFDVPAFGGMTLDLAPGSMTGIEGSEMLGIFGDLVPAAATYRRGVATSVEVVRVHRDRPAVELRLGGDPVSPGAELEWSVRVDGGYWSPYSRAPRLTLQRQAFRLLGTHTIEVRAREVGVPATTGQPEVIDVDIRRPLPELQRADPVIGFHGTADGSGGCDCDAGAGSGGAAGLALLVGVVVLGLRWRRGRLASLACGALVVVAIGCGSDPSDGDDGDGEPDPTVVNPGPTGRWASMAADGDRIVLAAYEQELGDLVLAEPDGDGRPEFAVIDGAPDEPVVLDPAGYRGGVNAPGANVGAYTSVALVGGEAWIAYQDLDRHALRFIREDGGAWTAIDVDVPEDDATRAGAYASLAIDGAAAPAIAYMAMTHLPGETEDDPGQLSSELRVARESASGAWEIDVVDQLTWPVDPEFEDLPPATGLFARAGVLPDGRLVIAFHRQPTGDLLLALENPDADAEAETGWRLVELDAGPDVVRGQWATMAIDDAGVVTVAYQDAVNDRLLAIQWTEAEGAGSPEVIDDGRREGDRPHSVGGGARLVDAGGTLVVAYQDGTTADLLFAAREGEGSWTREALLAGEIGYGFHIAATVSADTVWVSTYTYDQSSWPPGHTEVRRLAP